jgi:hypothetical protein
MIVLLSQVPVVVVTKLALLLYSIRLAGVLPIMANSVITIKALQMFLFLLVLVFAEYIEHE